MRFTRVLTVLLVIAALLGIAGCGSSEQEQVWNSFVEAVADKRTDDALGYIDFGRMVQKIFGDDQDAVAAMAFLGGPEASAEWVEGLFREALAQPDAEGSTSGTLEKMDNPASVKTEGDYSTLTFNVDGNEFTVEMEKIDGVWKIVDFGDAFEEADSSTSAEEAGSSIGAEGAVEELPGGPGQYTSGLDGTVVNVDVPAADDDELVVEIETYRKAIDAAPVSYLLVTIDNREGSDESYFWGITVVTEEGAQIEFLSASEVVGDWFMDLLDDGLYDQGVDLSNKHLNKTMVLPGAISETVFMAPQELSSVRSVWLDGQQMEKVE